MPSNAIGLLLGGSSSPSLALAMSVLRWEGLWVWRGIATLVGAVPCIGRSPRQPGAGGGRVETPDYSRMHGRCRLGGMPSVYQSRRRAAGALGDCATSTMWRCLAGEDKESAERTCRSAPPGRLRLLALISCSSLCWQGGEMTRCGTGVAALSRMCRTSVTAALAFPRAYAAFPGLDSLACACGTVRCASCRRNNGGTCCVLIVRGGCRSRKRSEWCERESRAD